ncbi:hypothetical protein P152DRAFT_310717 [Eremomyces bilateralis CBS 781.70]|uniref:Uncharacterized protein n=1 Tax=Eremomyces bilateralis CBS 781.70 TaxID=1392243 RepID=A0A6G1G596_9PEZI|nr:uncharacterized protein P152DRAFT_310717 [Eremomyces bilateralis CBS 781.70]KAF1813233.1 hypothetical protein P152DRAFT_310717 [Eremomyces bilateralis CBS 781.70]
MVMYPISSCMIKTKKILNTFASPRLAPLLIDMVVTCKLHQRIDHDTNRHPFWQMQYEESHMEIVPSFPCVHPIPPKSYTRPPNSAAILEAPTQYPIHRSRTGTKNRVPGPFDRSSSLKNPSFTLEFTLPSSASEFSSICWPDSRGISACLSTVVRASPATDWS